MAYCSPEIISGGSHNEQTDLWSVGILFYILLYGQFPFISNNKNIYKQNILFQRVQLEMPGHELIS